MRENILLYVVEAGVLGYKQLEFIHEHVPYSSTTDCSRFLNNWVYRSLFDAKVQVQNSR